MARLTLTNQIRDFAAFAQEKGLQFNLYVRRSTELSCPLMDAIKSGLVNLRFLR